MLFLIFLISVVTLEGILRYDEAVERKAKRQQAPPQAPLLEIAPADSSTGYSPETPGLLTLAKAIEQHNIEQHNTEQHNHEAQRPDATSSSNDLVDQSLERAQGR